MKQETQAIVAAAIGAYLEQEMAAQAAAHLQAVPVAQGTLLMSAGTNGRVAAIVAAVNAYMEIEAGARIFKETDQPTPQPTRITADGPWRFFGRQETMRSRFQWRTRIHKTN